MSTEVIRNQPVTGALPSRRRFLIHSGVFAGGVFVGTALTGISGRVPERRPVVRFGVVTDLHYSNRGPSRNRFYAESLAKLEEAVDGFNHFGCDFVMELGDLIDQGESPAQELSFVSEMTSRLNQCDGSIHYVLGNHCVQGLTKKKFLEGVKQDTSTQVFAQGGVTFVVLDACYRQDGVSYDAGNFKWTDTAIPPEQQEWLVDVLNRAKTPVFVFVHQRLDPTDDNLHSVKNGAEVRQILEDSGKVIAVLQGHHHCNDHQLINGVHYVTLAALVEGSGPRNSAYGIVDVYQDGSFVIDGFHTQRDWRFRARQAVPVA